MLEIMKKYNELVKRWNDAESYFKNETITIQKKIEHNDELILLHERIVTTQESIVRLGYDMSEDETRRGFRQIQFLEERGCIQK